MPTVPPIPADVQIVERDGRITTFFRLAWEAVRARFAVAPTVATLSLTAQAAALATTTLFTTLSAGLYRVSVYTRVTTPDGVSSSVQVTLGWSEGAVPLTTLSATVNGDTVTSLDSMSATIQVDGVTPITLAASYASNTPGAMHYEILAAVEQLG